MTTRRRRIGSESEQYSHGNFTPQQSFITEGGNSSDNLDYSDYKKLPFTPQFPTEDYNMPRERTLEFNNVIRSLQGRNIIRAVAAKDVRKAQFVQNYGEFMLIAKTIGKNISSTYAKLEKLTLLAKRKSLFNDKPTEIQELTYIIKEDLNSLNQQIAKLQQVAKHQKDVISTGHQHLLSHSSSVVFALQSKLASMSTEFKNVLEVRTENLKQAKSRREQYSGGNAPVAMSTPQQQGSVLLADEQCAIDMSDSQLQQQQKQQQMMLYEDQSDQFVQSRADTMQNIESTIVELGGIFQQLAHMVQEQEEMVERIDANILDTELHVESAHREILKYFQSVTSNRWLMIKIFAVLIFFFIFFVVFLA